MFCAVVLDARRLSYDIPDDWRQYITNEVTEGKFKKKLYFDKVIL